jgi:apolipoprotein N-acyltransferase
MTLARAVEVRRPLVRSTNTGISAAILATGEVLETSPTYEDWHGLYEIPYATRPPTTIS